jgi:hypothetical protein
MLVTHVFGLVFGTIDIGFLMRFMKFQRLQEFTRDTELNDSVLFSQGLLALTSWSDRFEPIAQSKTLHRQRGSRSSHHMG